VRGTRLEDAMQVLVNSDNHILGRESLAAWVQEQVEAALGRFGDRITRVEVHLNDLNSPTKAGTDDKRCMVEARLGGMPPVAVSHQAPALREAVSGALDKIEKSLERKLSRFATLKGRATED
jgi:ribosome-associated translation inhibitor RaiA